MENHNHAFDSVSAVECTDGDLVITQDCQSPVPEGTSVSPSGRIHHHEKPCEASKVDSYRLLYIVDYHDYHDAPETSITVDEIDELPDWAEHAKEVAEGQIEHRTPDLFMTHLSGEEIPITVATSDTEYNVIYNRYQTEIV